MSAGGDCAAPKDANENANHTVNVRITMSLLGVRAGASRRRA